VAGFSWSFGTGYYNILVIKLDITGRVFWQKSYGGEGKEYLSGIIMFIILPVKLTLGRRIESS
jgi:hypothetical protein